MIMLRHRNGFALCVFCVFVPLDFAHILGDVIKWKHFRRCWPFVRGIHQSPLIKAIDAEL